MKTEKIIATNIHRFLESGLYGRIKIKPYSTGELANRYNMSVKVFNRMIEPFRHIIGERNGRFYTVLQVGLIYEMVGPPGDEDE